MSNSKFLLTVLLTLLFCVGHYSFLMAQKDATLDVPKPEKYENRILGSDKTFTTKYTIPRRLMQGMSTHYNFFFNANVKLSEVLAGAKQSFREDYTELLPFYDYTLDATAAQKTELDSVLQKCNAGILLHDLRNEWIDDMYFLMGKAYFFRKAFDSAYITFQYLNFYFQPKTEEELGFKKFIGSNLNQEGNVYSVSTKEKTGIRARVFTEPPRRNDALVWQIRNYIEDSSYGTASALIQTLRRDQFFPSRLKPELEEMQAYLFYKNKVWDSAAHYLIPALENTETIGEKARREFLIGQLFTLARNTAEANAFFDRAIKHTIDPVMDVYARLNKIKLAQGESEAQIIDENIKQLLKMARRDKYYNYRDIIYYMAAQMEMQRNQFESAKVWLLRSVKYSHNNADQRNRSYLYLGDLAFERKEYELAFSAYDSLDVNTPVVKTAAQITQRKDRLGGVIQKMHIVRVEDSLQRVASLPEEDREKYVKAAARRLRKERGLQEDGLATTNNNPFANNTTTDIFSGNEGKGDWYFDNNASKSKGFSAFRNSWGTRPNVDNWRRTADITASLNTPQQNRDNQPSNPMEKTDQPEDISYEGLMKTLPLTPEAVQISNDSIQSALFGLGKDFKDKFEDYAEAIKYYDSLLNRFPDTRYKEIAVFDLYYCYTKLNMPVKAKLYRDILAKIAPQSPYLEFIENPNAVEERRTRLKNQATREYEKIYDLFLSGRFEEAIIRKANADSIFGSAYWNQQLLYIEAVYYIKQRDENSAVNALQKLIQIDPRTPLSEKADRIIDVLKRRDEIERYLTNLKVERVKEDTVAAVEEKPVVATQEQVSVAVQPKAKEVVSEKVKPVTPAINSTVFKKPPQVKQAGFSYNPAEHHLVAVVLHQVDMVYVNEAKNAFNRYNRESYRDLPLEIAIWPLNDEDKFMLMSGFSDALGALDYMYKVQRIAGAQIVPWLSAGKYSFIVISESNLNVLKNNKDMESYRQFVDSNYPKP